MARASSISAQAGAGQLCKAVNQICIAGLVQGLSEGVHFAARAGLDIDKVFEAISGGAAQSWQMENRAKTMARRRVRVWLCGRLDAQGSAHRACRSSRTCGARLPVTALVDQFYADIQAMGGGRWDTSSLVRRLNGHLINLGIFLSSVNCTIRTVATRWLKTRKRAQAIFGANPAAITLSANAVRSQTIAALGSRGDVT